jgi:glucokinase
MSHQSRSDHPLPVATPCAIGLDVGGTKIAGGLVEQSTGQLLAHQVTPTLPLRGGQAVLEDTRALAYELMLEADTQGCTVLGIGVGVPELVDPAGRITSAYNFDWQALPVQATLAELAPAVVEADVRAGALAEAMYGAGRDYRLFCYVTVGTGISYTLMQDGRPYAGAHGNALLLASSPLTTVCSTCGTVLRPVLEEFAGGPGLVASYNAATGAHTTRAEQVLAAAQHDEQAAAILRHAGTALGVSVGFLINVLDPEAVIVGGGLGSADGLYWDAFTAATREHIWSEAHRTLPILHAALGPEAGIIGAAATVLQRVG